MGTRYDRIGLLTYGLLALGAAFLLGLGVAGGLADLAGCAGLATGVCMLVIYQELP